MPVIESHPFDDEAFFLVILHVERVILMLVKKNSPILNKPCETRRVPSRKNQNTKYVPFAVVVTCPRCSFEYCQNKNAGSGEGEGDDDDDE
jgi:hypothetical protein